jgi:O-antigen ligase
MFAFPLGMSMVTILAIAVVLGAVLHRKHFPKSKLYLIWLVYGIYLYISMWMGYEMGTMPAPVSLTDGSFVVWKEYMEVPLVFVATALLVEDRKSIKIVIFLTALTLFGIDFISIHSSSAARASATFDEALRPAGPLGYNANYTAAFLAQLAMFFWGFLQFVKAKTSKARALKLAGYGLVAYTLFANLYTFSRGGYLATLVGIFVLGILKDRKLLVILGFFLLTWQTVVPNSVRERVTMTQDANGQLDSSAEGRIELWKESWNSFIHSPIVGNGFSSFSYGEHVVSDLKDTHNFFMKVLVETGLIGCILFFPLLQQMLAVGFRLFRRATDPLYRGLGLGLFIAVCCAIVANIFGDRWTVLEVSGPLWVLVGAAVRATQLSAEEPLSEPNPVNAKAPALTYSARRSGSSLGLHSHVRRLTAPLTAMLANMQYREPCAQKRWTSI